MTVSTPNRLSVSTAVQGANSLPTWPFVQHSAQPPMYAAFMTWPTRQFWSNSIGLMSPSADCSRRWLLNLSQSITSSIDARWMANILPYSLPTFRWPPRPSVGALFQQSPLRRIDKRTPQLLSAFGHMPLQ
jgi:hypothetical protein